MRGEYLSLMVSLELNLTLLLSELLNATNHLTEFQEWFTKAPIPFGWKADLFEPLIKGDTQLGQFKNLISHRGLL